MTYTIASGKSFNMVLSHVDKTDPATWHSADLLGDMRRCFQKWDPKYVLNLPLVCWTVVLMFSTRLLKIIGMIDKTMKWPLMTVPTMRRWISDSRKLLVLGDAAHAMVPYMSQGKFSKHG
jgi:salicylate hydroxylase